MARHSAIIGPSRLIASGAAAALVPALGAGGARAQIVGTGGAQAYARNVGDLEVIALLDGHFPLGGGMMINIDENTVAGALRESYHDPDQPVATGITPPSSSAVATARS